jgi:large subunit ribosomal protein L10
MPTEKKEKVVKTLEEIFAKAKAGVITNYRGLKTPEINELRRKLKENDAEYKVVKNSLAQIAAKNTGNAYLDNTLKGPVGVAFGYGDAAKMVKTVSDHLRTTKSAMKMEWGFIDKRVFTGDELETLAKLPSREILLAKVVGGMQAPVYGIVNVLAAPLRGLAQVLQARVKQMEAK